MLFPDIINDDILEEQEQEQEEEAAAEYMYLSETQVQTLINAGVPNDIIMEMDEAKVEMPDNSVIPSLVNVIRQLEEEGIIDHFNGFCELGRDSPDDPGLQPLSNEQRLKLLEHDGHCSPGIIPRRWLTPSANAYKMVIGSFEEFLSCTDIGFDYGDLEDSPLMCLKLLRELPKIEEASRGIITMNRLVYHYHIYESDTKIYFTEDLADMLYNDDLEFYESIAILSDKAWKLLSDLPADVTLPDEIIDLILNFLPLNDIFVMCNYLLN